MIYLKTSVGVELREEDLLISCLKSNFSTPVFTDFKRITGYRTRDRAEVRREVEEFFKNRRIGRESIILGIPRHDAIIRHLEFPKEVEDNLKQVVLYQVQSFAPSDEEKFYHDFVVMGSPPPANRLQVVLVMIRKAVLDTHLEVVKSIGINPAGVTVGSIALAGLFLQSRADAGYQTFVMADLKSQGFEILALRNGALVYTREAGRDGNRSWKECLISEVELAAGKIRLGPQDTIEKIVLAGEESETAQREVREILDDCELIGSHVQFELPVGQRAHLQEGATALGLAFAGIVRRPALACNLLPPEMRSQQTRWAYIPSVILGLIIVALLAALGFRGMIQERIMVRRLDQEISDLKGRVERVQGIRSQVEALEKKISYLEGLFRRGDMNLEIIQELTTLLPPDTFLSLYSNRDGTIQITGSSGSASELISKLERSPLLMSVQQRGTIFKDAQTSKDRFNFEMKLER